MQDDGKITLKSKWGKYVSAQPDGRVEINRQKALGWETFTVEYSGNNVVCLKSCHGKYLSAQPNGTAEWNRTGTSEWENIEIVLVSLRMLLDAKQVSPF